MFKGTVKGSLANPHYSDSRIRKRIQEAVGDLIIESIQEVLGNAAELGYDVSDDWAIRKSKDPRLKRIPGKSSNQPLILKADIYENLIVEESGDGFIIQVKEGKGVSEKGFDYADYFEKEFQSDGLGFMQKGLDRVRHKIPEVVKRIVLEETGL